MATCEPTKWVILGNGVRTDLAPGGGGLVAQLRLLTTGPTDEIAARVQEIGPADAGQRLRELVAGHERIQRYRLVRTEDNAIAGQIHALQSTGARLYAERQELLVHAEPGFAPRVAALDKKATEVEAKVTEAKESQEAIRTTLARAKQDAVAAVQLIARDVSARITWELGAAHDLIIDKIAPAVGPILTEFAALGQAHLLALGGGLITGVDALVEELASVQAVAPEAVDTPIAAPEKAVDGAPPIEGAPETISEPGRCQTVKPDGQRCKGRSLPGLSVCVLHRRAESRLAEDADASASAVPTGA